MRKISRDCLSVMQVPNVSRRAGRVQLASALLVALFCSAPGLALAAAPEDALNFAVGTSARYDDNLFRLPSGSAVPGRGSRSDILYTAYAGIRLDKAYSLQRFQFDLTATQYTYRSNDALNFSALDYRTAWLWALTPRLTGTLAADQTTELANYATLQSPGNSNKRTNQNQSVTADWWATGGWHLTGGAYRLRSVADSGELTAAGNFVQNTAEGGILYVSAANNSIAAVHRVAQGDYLGRSLDAVSLLDTHYTQRETELHSIYQLGGHSRLDARLGYRDRTHEHFSQRNFSGTVGSLAYLWTPTGKLQFTLATGRDLVSYQDSINSYYSLNYLSLTPVWLVSDKTTIRLKLDVNQYDYRGAIVPVSPMREDTIRAAQLGVAWRPTRTITVDGYVTHEQRSSNVANLPYHANIVGISASGVF